MDQAYTPHLKKVLKSYQEAATTSLHGPNTFMASWRPSKAAKVYESPKSAEEGKPKASSEYDPFLAPPPFPIQQPPIITPSDQSRWERSETILEGETISCFIVGGEKRLCLPQILNTVLRDFSLQQINSVCDDLHIFCSRCNAEQLEVLKVTGILPASAPSCGLITKTDAERLCAELLRHCPQDPTLLRSSDKLFSFKVYHECFGKCTGIYTPDLYTSPTGRCVECVECHVLFSPQKFVCHAHKSKENRTCHWGFDSANWRAYILLARDQPGLERLQQHLDDMKNRFDYTPKLKRKHHQLAIEAQEPAKRFRADENFPYAYPYALPWDPALVYWCPEGGQWTCASAFKPWSAVFAKDEKGTVVMPPLLSPQMPENSPPSLPSHLSHDPPVLQNPERVVPMSESKRFERHYQPNVALAPVSSQHQYSKTEAVPKGVPLTTKSAVHVEAPKVVKSEVTSCVDILERDDFSQDEMLSMNFSDNLKNLQNLLEENQVDEVLQKKILKEVNVIISRCQAHVLRSITKRKSVHKTTHDLKHLPDEVQPELFVSSKESVCLAVKLVSPAGAPESLQRTASCESTVDGSEPDDSDNTTDDVSSAPVPNPQCTSDDRPSFSSPREKE